MAVLKNRVGVVTTTTGTGTITLGAPLTSAQTPNNAGWQSFATGGVANGDSVRYLVLDANGAWEYGPGTFASGPGTLTRPATAMDGTIAGQKSSTGALLALSGNAQVFITAVAEDIVSPSGAIAANDVAQWATSTTIKGVSLTTWRTNANFFDKLTVKLNAGSDGPYLRGLAGQGWLGCEGATADISLVLSSKGSGVISFYNGDFGRLCAQFTSAPSANTFPTFTGNVGFCGLASNPTGNPIVMGSVMKLLGATDGVAVAAGVVGEEFVFRRDFSTRTGLSTATYNPMASFTLSPGEWELSFTCGFHAEATPVGNAVQSGLTINSSYIPTGDFDGNLGGPLFVGGMMFVSGYMSMSVAPYTVRLSSPRTYYFFMWHNLGAAVPTYGTHLVRAKRVG